MTSAQLKKRTFDFSLAIVQAVGRLPKTPVADVLGRQLLRSGTSVGANYRAAARARSRADFIAKLGIVEEECDETMYWMEMLGAARIAKESDLKSLHAEANELLAITVSSIKTARSNK
jgi:four helix bundle protein